MDIEGANRDEEWKAKEEMKRETKEVGPERLELVVNEVEKNL